MCFVADIRFVSVLVVMELQRILMDGRIDNETVIL